MSLNKLLKSAAGLAGGGGPPPEPGDTHFSKVVALLAGDGTNGAQNSSYVDSSANSAPFSAIGSGVTQGSFSPYQPFGWAVEVGATGYLTAPHHAGFAWTSDWTIEMWFKFPTVPAGTKYLFSKGAGFQLYDNNGALCVALSANNSTTYFLTAVAITTPTDGNWHHVAVVKSGTSYKYYLDGVGYNIGTSASNVDSGTSGVSIAAYGAGQYLMANSGQLSNVRCVFGTALYIANFTPTTTELTAVTGTQLLCCQANRFIDASANALAITPNSTVKVIAGAPFSYPTAYSKTTHGGSVYVGGAGGILGTQGSWAPGTGDFTLELWFYPEGTQAANACLIDLGGTSAGYLHYGYYSTTGFGIAVSSGWIQAGATKPIPYMWNYLVVTRASGTLRIYLNGALDTTQASITTDFYATSGTVIGNLGDVSYANAAKGFFSDVHIIKGYAKYTGASITVPTAPISPYSTAKCMLRGANAGVYDSACRSNLTTLGNAQVSTTQVKFGQSMYFDGTGDYVSAPPSLQFDFGTKDFTIECWVRPATLGAHWAVFDTGVNTGETGVALHWNSVNGLAWNTASGYSAMATTAESAAAGLAINVWTHLAMVRHNGTAKLYINGVWTGYGNANSSNFVANHVWVANWYTGGYYYSGYIDDLRITKGVSRYTANFTPPTVAHLLR